MTKAVDTLLDRIREARIAFQKNRTPENAEAWDDAYVALYGSESKTGLVYVPPPDGAVGHNLPNYIEAMSRPALQRAA